MLTNQTGMWMRVSTFASIMHIFNILVKFYNGKFENIGNVEESANLSFKKFARILINHSRFKF